LASTPIVAEVNVHGPEFVNEKTAIVVAVAFLSKENRAWRRDFDGDCNANQQGRKQEKPNARTDDVKRALRSQKRI